MLQETWIELNRTCQWVRTDRQPISDQSCFNNFEVCLSWDLAVFEITSAEAVWICVYLPRRVYPGQVAEVGIHRHCNDFTVHIMKFIGFVTESNNFCRTHKGARKKGRNSYQRMFFKRLLKSEQQLSKEQFYFHKGEKGKMVNHPQWTPGHNDTPV